MSTIAFWLFYPLIWFLSILPFRVLYVISDFCYLIVYHIIGYRKKTVHYNLSISFPEKSDTELKRIERKFYHHLCDMFIEMIKTMSITKEQLLERYKFNNIELVEKYDKNNQSFIMMLGHYASYEWVFALQLHVQQPGYAVYKKIKNNQFDKLIHKIRGRWNTYLVESSKIIRDINKHQKKRISAVYGFVADQSPKLSKAYFWAQFLGHEVPFFTGTERMAKKFDLPVVFYNVEKVGRGRYEGTFYTLAEKGDQNKEGDITTAYIQLLEKQIRKEPAYYLWTHKRFKLLGRKEEILAKIGKK